MAVNVLAHKNCITLRVMGKPLLAATRTKRGKVIVGAQQLIKIGNASMAENSCF